MSKWVEEVFQAPRDAWGLLLGLASALSILALVRHEFATEPLRVVLQNWSAWSHSFWSNIAGLVDWHPTASYAAALTAVVLTWAMVLRGYARNQVVAFFETRDRAWLKSIPIFLIGVGFAIILASEVLRPIEGTDTRTLSLFEGLLGISLLYVGIPLGLTVCFMKTPRSFFGVAIAGIALLLIDQIPLLPAATGG